MSFESGIGYLRGYDLGFRFYVDGLGLLYLWVVWTITGSVLLFVHEYIGKDL